MEREFRLKMKHSDFTLCFTGDGATNVNLFRLFKSINKFDNSVRVIDWDRLHKFSKTEQINGINYTFILHGWGYKNRWLLIGYIFWMWKVFLYALQNKPKRIWVSNFQNGLPVAVAAIFTKTPFIYYIHDNISISYPWPKLITKLVEKVDNWIIKKAAVVIVPDENRILPHANHLTHKFVILPNVPYRREKPNMSQSHNSKFTIFVLGTIWDSRGIDTLLSAVKGINDIRILVAGNIPQKQVLDKLLADSKVDYRGLLPQKDVFDLYQESDIIFSFYDPSLPINQKASPTKIYESMMMGKPVLVNEEIFFSKKVIDWDIGYSCGYWDINGLHITIQSIKNCSNELKNKGAKAYFLHRNKYNWEEYEKTYWEILSQV